MTFDDVAKLGLPPGQGGSRTDPHPENEIAPPGGISFREAMRMVGSGRATLAPTGVVIVTTAGVIYRQIDRAVGTGLVPDPPEAPA
jgi:hypothetical protein